MYVIISLYLYSLFQGTTDDDGDDGDDEALCNKAALVAAVYALGGMAGALLAGPLVNLAALGRRPVYLVNLTIFISGYTLIGLSQTYTQIIVGRLLTGFATGVTGYELYIMCNL